MKIDIDSFEENFHSPKKKKEKQERKLLQSLDRSQFKKTDQKSAVEETIAPHLIKGRVLSISGENILVDADHTQYICYLRGIFKKEKTLLKNPLAVGDFVMFCPETKHIEKIEERFSYLSREDLLRRKEHILAANIDQVLITISVVQPPLKPSLVDRYILATKKGNMSPVLVINKIDLLQDPHQSKEKELYEEFVHAFSKENIPIISVSTVTNEGIEDLKKIMKDKASVFAGQSGVGKSSLINATLGLHLKTGEVIKKTSKGSHVTSKAQLFPLKDGGFCIDTPGIKSFGLWEFKKEDIQRYFTEVFHLSNPCKYPDCSHLNEPNCAVQKAIEEGKISPLRFASYHSLMNELETDDFRKR
ncbi:MAG: ribosome small subunit-dependent GTPase A [Chlamydiota bacterium]